MPLNCPLCFSAYNACMGCRQHHSNECWADFPYPQKLNNILTLEERITILEDKDILTNGKAADSTENGYQQLLKRILLLKEKLNTHIGKTSKKIKSKYD